MDVILSLKTESYGGFQCLFEIKLRLILASKTPNNSIMLLMRPMFSQITDFLQNAHNNQVSHADRYSGLARIASRLLYLPERCCALVQLYLEIQGSAAINSLMSRKLRNRTVRLLIPE
jgi:hypothetical protein